jgi:integrase
MKQLPGFHYDAKRKRATFDGFVRGTGGEVRRRRTIRNVTRDQALVHWKAFRTELEKGLAPNGPLTFAAFVTGHLPKIAKKQQESTRKTQWNLIKNLLLPHFGTMHLAKITSVAVDDFMAEEKERGRSPVYINNAVRVLKMLLRQAVERDVLDDYPLKKKVGRLPEDELKQELTTEERARFVAVFDDEEAFRGHLAARQKCGVVRESDGFSAPRRFGGGLRGDSAAAGAYFQRFRELREFFIVAVETGLRKADLRDLSWRQIDLHAGFIRVVMQKTRFKAEIPISRACRDALLTAAQRSGGHSGYVFLDHRRERYPLTRIRRTFVLAIDLAKIEHRVRIHDLRHTFASRLASKSVGLQIIATALGHKSTRMSERYARPSQEAMRAIASALDSDR